MKFNKFCISSFLTFRYVVEKNKGWTDKIIPTFSQSSNTDKLKVKTTEDILNILTKIMKGYSKEDTGILLSSGIDSAILGKLLPKKTKAYTVRFVAKEAVNELDGARQIAEHNRLDHTVIDITWEDYLKHCDFLMKNKKSPLHPVEVPLYVASLQAKKDGITNLVTGDCADVTFGGFDKLLSKTWIFNEFIERYTFVNPQLVVNNPVSMVYKFKEYKIDDGIDLMKFLKIVHGNGLIQSFTSSINLAGCEIVAPYENLLLDVKLDFDRIRKGESKYLLKEVFRKLYPNIQVPPKIAFARPMGEWMKFYKGPSREEFIPNLDMKKFTGEQKWLIYCLERFMNLMENE